MSITITASTGGTTTPQLVMDYAATRQGRSIVHQLAAGGIVVSLIPADPRSGLLRLFYPDETDAKAAVDLHALAASFALVDTDRPTFAMSYVVSGPVTVTLDPATLNVWTVDVTFQEVVP